MTDRWRIAIVLATALMLGAFRYGHAFQFDPPGVLGEVWHGSVLGLAVYGLAILGVFLVYRWWALLPAIAPGAVNVYLHNFTDYVYPYRDEIGLSDADGPLYVVLVILGTGLQAAYLALGLLLRWVWERSRPARLRAFAR